MARARTLQDLFKRYRRPGDLVFAMVFLIFSGWLLSQLSHETRWMARTKLFSQPSFWPAVSLITMTLFAFLHWLGSICSPRLHGRWAEVGFWLRAVEYALWFMGYVLIVPFLGYLPSTVVFTLILTLRAGYRDKRFLISAIFAGCAIVITFKSFLQVKVPGGQVYEYLPDGLRAFMLTYF